MIILDYLDQLYTWKVESEQKLKQLEASRGDVLPKEEAEYLIKLRESKIDNIKYSIQIYKASIALYISLHKS